MLERKKQGDYGFATRAVHVGNAVDKDSGAIIGKTEYLDQIRAQSQVKLETGATTITFTPGHAGSYSYSCWMGMLRNTITVVELKESVVSG